MIKKKIVLYSQNPNEYSDIVVECYFIQDIRKYVEKLLSFKTLQIAKKTAVVNTRPGLIGEKITTLTPVERDGKLYRIIETINEVKSEGCVVVTNPGGEEYIVKPNIINDTTRYKKISNAGEYRAIGKPMKLVEVTDDIFFNAPWGGEMFVLKGGMLNITDIDRVYGIQNLAYKQTYETIHNDTVLTNMK